MLDGYLNAAVAAEEDELPADMKMWRDQIRDEVDSIADEAGQRREWFGIGPVADSPIELFCRFFDNAAVSIFFQARRQRADGRAGRGVVTFDCDDARVERA